MADKGEKKHSKHVAPKREKNENAAAETKERSPGNESGPREPWQMEDTSGNEVSVPAIHHVGPTLESDPTFHDIPSSGPTPEAIIGELGVRLPGEGVDRDIDPQPELENQTARGGERLRTRLAGDTSSDPHTDVGPDNAATVQHRGEPQPRKPQPREQEQHRPKHKRHAA
jgi:hypothetical protein